MSKDKKTETVATATTSSKSLVSLGTLLANTAPKQVAEFQLPIECEEGVQLPISYTRFNAKSTIPGKSSIVNAAHIVTMVTLSLVNYPSRRLNNLGDDATGISYNIFGLLCEMDKEGKPILGENGLPILKEGENDPKLMHSYRVGLSKWPSHLFPSERQGIWEPELRANASVPQKVPLDANGKPVTVSNNNGTGTRLANQVPDRDYISWDVNVFNAILVNAPVLDDPNLNLIIDHLKAEVESRQSAEEANKQSSIQEQAKTASQQQSADF